LNLKNINNVKDSDAFNAVYKACIYEYMIKNRTEDSKTWCAPLTQRMFEMVEFREDLEKYCEYGHKYKISSQSTCDLRKHLLKYFRDILA
jgi:hypothetical protein